MLLQGDVKTMNKCILVCVLAIGSGCYVDSRSASDAGMAALPSDAAQDPRASEVSDRSVGRLFGGGYPTSGSTNATSILGVPIGTIGGVGSVLTVAAGPALQWEVPASGVMLSSTTPAGVSTTAGAVGVGTTAARSDHTHLLPIVPLALGGFGADVSAGQTNGYYAKIVGGALTLAAILAGDLPTGIDVAKLAAGTVSNTVFGYLANVTSDIQAQLALLLPASSTKLPPTPSGAGGTLYDNGTAWTRLAPGTANYLYQANGAAAPGWVSSLSGITINCSSNTCTNIASASLLGGIDALKLGAGLVDNTELGYLNGATSNLQGQIDSIVASMVALSSTLPASVGTAAIGVSSTAARADHVHAHGSQAGGSLHADAIAGGASGFLSGTDKTKLNAVPTPAGGTVNLATSDYTVTGLFADIGLNAALPDAGTYRITIDLWTVINTGSPSTGDQLVYLRLYDNTAGAVVANSDRSLGCIDAGGLSASFSSSVTFRVTVASGRTIKTQAYIDGSEDAHIKSGGSGFQYTQLNWEKVSN